MVVLYLRDFVVAVQLRRFVRVSGSAERAVVEPKETETNEMRPGWGGMTLEFFLLG